MGDEGGTAVGHDDSVNAGFCSGCGRSTQACDGCLPALDPPRYCAGCGTWMAVRVSTGGWVARCRTCDLEVRSDR